MRVDLSCHKHHVLFAAALVAAALLGPLSGNGWASGSAPPDPHAEAEEEDTGPSASGVRGVELGEFNIQMFRPIPSRKDHVTFNLYATIREEDFKEFQRLYKRRRHKVRDQIIVATRLVAIEDYDDPELKYFRRRILLRLRRTMPELRIDDIQINDFTLTAQST